MTDLRKAAELALEALEDVFNLEKKDVGAINALRQALAQPEQESVGVCVTCDAPKSEWLVDAVNISQECVDKTAKGEHEPVAWIYRGNFHPFDPSDWAKGETATPLYTTPPKREWVGLTDEEIDAAVKSCNTLDTYKYFRAIEAKLKEKNT